MATKNENTAIINNLDIFKEVLTEDNLKNVAVPREARGLINWDEVGQAVDSFFAQTLAHGSVSNAGVLPRGRARADMTVYEAGAIGGNITRRLVDLGKEVLNQLGEAQPQLSVQWMGHDDEQEAIRVAEERGGRQRPAPSK